jgi:hypothetical protein
MDKQSNTFNLIFLTLDNIYVSLNEIIFLKKMSWLWLLNYLVIPSLEKKNPKNEII